MILGFNSYSQYDDLSHILHLWFVAGYCVAFADIVYNEIIFY